MVIQKYAMNQIYILRYGDVISMDYYVEFIYGFIYLMWFLLTFAVIFAIVTTIILVKEKIHHGRTEKNSKRGTRFFKRG